MAVSTTSSWRGFSTLVQTAADVAQPVNNTFYYDGDPLSTEGDGYISNAGHATGELGATEARLLRKKLAGAHKGPWLTPHLAGMFCSMVMGKCTSAVIGVSTAWKHKIEIDKNMTALPVRTMIQYDGLAQFRYRGVAASGFKMSGKRGDFVMFDADVVGTGYEETDATAKPARVTESYLTFADAVLTRGGTYDGTAVTGGTNMRTAVTDFSLAVKNGAASVHWMGSYPGVPAAASEIRRAEQMEVELEVGFEVADQTHQDALIAGTEYVLALPIVGGVANAGNNYTVEVIVPRARYMEAKKAKKDGVLHVAAKFEALVDATYGRLIINVINLHNKSYLATA